MSDQLAPTVSSFADDGLLESLSDPCRAALSKRWRVTNHPAGQLLISEEDHSNDIYFVLKGVARSATFTVNGREVAFADIGPGDCFGELSAIDHLPRSTSVVALEDISIARLPGREFDALLSTQPELSRALLRHISGKLRDLSRRLVEFSAMTGQKRVCGELLRIGRKHRNQLDSAVILRPPTQAELAKLIFTTRETVAREMSRLQRNGLLTRTRAEWRIPSLSRLEREVAMLD